MERYTELFKVTVNNFGKGQYTQIMMDQNTGIVNAFIIAAVIAFLGALLGVQLSYMVVKRLKLIYDKFLNDQKQLAITNKQSKEVENEEGDLDLSKIVVSFEKFGKVYEHRELFRTTFKADRDLILEKKLKFRFSLFQIPALLLDFIFRTKVINSLR